MSVVGGSAMKKLSIIFIILLAIAAVHAEEMAEPAATTTDTSMSSTGGSATSVPNFVLPQFVKLIDYNPRPVQPGQSVDVILQVERNPLFDQPKKNYESNGAWIEIVDEYPFTVEKTFDYERAKNLGTLASGQKLQFRLRVDSNAKEGTTQLRVKYGTSTKDKGSYALYNFSMSVQTLDANVAVTKIVQEPATLQPGQKGKVYLTLTSYDSRPLRNVDVILDLTQSFNINDNMNNIIASQAMMNSMVQAATIRMANGQSPFMNGEQATTEPAEEGAMDNKKSFVAFAPQNTPTRQRFGTLNPGGSAVVEFDIIALPDAEPNVYAVPLIINYNDQRNNPYNIKTEVGLTVDSPPDVYVTIEKSMLRSTFFAGDVTVAVANRGSSTMKYVVLSMNDSEGYQIITAPKSTYLGNIMPGEKMMAMFKVLPTEKNLDFPMTVQYKDAFNNEHTMSVVIPFKVVNDMPYRDTSWEQMIVWLILGVVIAVLVGWYIKSSTGKGPKPTEKAHH
jgi:hypothetical protein